MLIAVVLLWYLQKIKDELVKHDVGLSNKR